MKPKNRKYCPYCQKAKLLFETEAKAENFLKYNADEIYNETGKKPVRVYYCMACGGWHVTSIKSFYSVSKMEHNLKEYSERINAKLEARRKETLVNELISMFRSKTKALERLISCHLITKEECLQRLQTLKKNFEVFRINITGHKKFINEMTIRMESLLRNCATVGCYTKNQSFKINSYEYL